jgi:hypothetical protein
VPAQLFIKTRLKSQTGYKFGKLLIYQIIRIALTISVAIADHF